MGIVMVRYLLILAMAWSSAAFAANEYICVYEGKQYSLKVSKTSMTFCPVGDSFGCDWHKDLVDVKKPTETEFIMTSKDGVETRMEYQGTSGVFILSWRMNDAKNKNNDPYHCTKAEA